MLAASFLDFYLIGKTSLSQHETLASLSFSFDLTVYDKTFEFGAFTVLLTAG